METETTWKIDGMKFYDPDDLGTLVKAEVGVTGKFLSFVSESPTGIRRRADFSVIAKSPDGMMRREFRGKVIRGLNEKAASRIIGIINQRLWRTGKILLIARRETSDGKETVIYKRRDKGPSEFRDDQQTPTVIMGGDTESEITAVTATPTNDRYSRRPRRSDTPV
jgi:hypothetical protein